MTATIKFDQSGLPAGVDNRSRSDIVAGTPVTITSVTPGTGDSVTLYWKPFEDDTAVIAGSGPTWEIIPKAGSEGTYRIGLTVDGEEIIKTFSIRTANKGLRIPAPNEFADPTASLIKNTSAEILASETNEAFAPFTSGSAWGWWKVLYDLIKSVDAGNGGVGLEFTAEKTGNYTAVNGEFVLSNPSGGAFQVDAPASPSDNDKFGVINHTTSTNAITVDGNGKNLNGQAQRTINQANQWRVWQYSSVSGQWLEVGG